ncbi:F0F1 ATP synthase subunit delta [Trueperella bialowiezensis]|uniref:ATP synthase subunit delta n=1 Tax=Trueperella bialowiezensis TaxID=312285 RepID=A0A3S4WH37_9ACTO|nr:F0F1 ATP synthase subunit delta [Trueperella bialowiezensis]VEI13764.1 F-type ATPase subunit delta [Trueperella bialowiezensis]
MRSGSRIALARARDRWEGLLANRPGEELKFAEEIFSVVDTIEESHALANALEDASRGEDDRANLAKAIFDGRVADEVTELTMGLARESWSEMGDLTRALEDLAVHAILYGARRESLLGQTEQQLYRSSRIYRKRRDLRLAFTSVIHTAEQRMDLVSEVFTGANPYTVSLLRRAVAREGRSIGSLLRGYIAAAAEMGEHLVAAVTSALPLKREQEERLTAILSAKYNSDVQIHVSIDTAVVGGLRIHIKDDVIDGTLASRLNRARAAVRK